MANNPIHPTQYLISIIYRSMDGLLADDGSRNIFQKESCSELLRLKDRFMSGELADLPGLAIIQKKLEDCFDDRSAHGILARAGRAAFHPFLVEYGEKFGWFNAEFNLLSPRTRFNRSLDLLSQNLYPRLSQSVTITGTDKAWFWSDPDCPWCHGRESNGSSCSFTTGFLQEFSYWAGAGKTFLVREVECLAAGGLACTYQIDKRALD